MRNRIVSLGLALVMSCCLCVSPAWAAASSASGTSAETSETLEVSDRATATKGDISTEGVTLSSDNLSAVIDGCVFALGDFERASVGSNREIGGEYHGYAYYIGSSPTALMYIVTADAVIVRIDPEQASVVNLDPDSADDIGQLQRLVVVLDAANSNGKTQIAESLPWYITTDSHVELNGVDYLFDEQIEDGGYNCVIGSDGQDVTDAESDDYLRLEYCCFSTLVAADDAVIVAQPTWTEEVGTMISTLDWSPLWVTLRTTLTAIVFIFVLGLAAAYFCLHRSPKARNVFDTIFTIPMVLPPTVCGFLLLLLLGNNTALGRFFIDIGFPLIFSWPATVIAAIVVAFPLMYRNALGAFDNLDPNMLDAARTLGWSEAKIFFKIMLPLSWSSIAAGTVLAFARALGEFGATLFLAGNYLGITRTIPIAIYFEWMNGNTDIALFWTIILVIFSFIVIMFINLWSQHTTRYRKGAVEE